MKMRGPIDDDGLGPFVDDEEGVFILRDRRKDSMDNLWIIYGYSIDNLRIVYG